MALDGDQVLSSTRDRGKKWVGRDRATGLIRSSPNQPPEFGQRGKHAPLCSVSNQVRCPVRDLANPFDRSARQWRSSLHIPRERKPPVFPPHPIHRKKRIQLLPRTPPESKIPTSTTQIETGVTVLRARRTLSARRLASSRSALVAQDPPKGG